MSALPPLPNHLSDEEARDLVDTIFPSNGKNGPKLTGREVLIPFSKYAFFPGRLQPKIDSETGEEIIEVASCKPGKEQIRTKCTVSRAREWLLQNQLNLKHSSEHSAPSKEATSTGAIQTPKVKQKSKSYAKEESLQSSTGFQSTFVEIQEEYDAHGTQTRGNVFDVGKQLKALLKNEKPDVNFAEEMKIDEGDGALAESEDLAEEESPPIKKLSDKEYESLSLRLEELARLEEEEERRQLGQKMKPKKKSVVTDTAKASSKSSGDSASKKKAGGWKKGFLNADTRKKSKKKTPSGLGPSISHKEEERKLPTFDSGPNTTVVTPATQQSKSSMSVSFDTSQNKVQEIPRLGSQKVPPRPTSAPIAATSSSDIRATKPLESSLFSGVVEEKAAIVERRPQISTIKERSPMIPKKKAAATTKKLSRFARERQGYVQ